MILRTRREQIERINVPALLDAATCVIIDGDGNGMAANLPHARLRRTSK